MSEVKNDRYIDKNGNVRWYIHGKLHREDGPALEFADGTKIWYINGECHREDGPAVENTDGSKHWYLNGIEHTEEEFNQWLEKKAVNERLHSELDEKPIKNQLKI